MKKILSYITISMLGALLLSTCKKDSTLSKGTMSFKIDGVLYTSDAPWYVVGGYSPPNNKNKMDFVSSEGSNGMKYPSLEIDFPDSTTVGTFSIVPNGSVRSSASFSSSSQGPTYNATSGQFVITKKTEIVIEGTFQFVLTNSANPSITKVITEGTFTVPLTSGLLF